MGQGRWFKGRQFTSEVILFNNVVIGHKDSRRNKRINSL
jgi:hypothetical protein